MGRLGCGKDRCVGRIGAWENVEMPWKSAGEGSGEGLGSLRSAGKGCGKVGSAREVPGGRRVK